MFWLDTILNRAVRLRLIYSDDILLICRKCCMTPIILLSTVASLNN